MNEYTFEISFRVTHPSMSPDMICDLLAMKADITRKAGEPRLNSKGKPLPGTWKETYCGFDVFRHKGDSIPECLETMLFNLEDRKKGLEEIRLTGGYLGFYVLASPIELTFGETFPWELSKRLAELKINLSIEIHKTGP